MKKSVFPGKPGEMQLAPLDLIDDNPYQPKNRPYGNLHTLAADIRQQCEALPETMGLIHVPRGRIVDSRIQLLEGHRRTRAFRLLKEQYGDNWRKMPVALGEFTDRQMSEISWSENNNREELDPISRAESLQQAIDEFGITLKEAGKRYPSKKGSMSKGAVSNLIRLLQLPEAVRELIRKGKIGQRHGRELVRLVQFPDEVQCRWKAQAAVDHNWTVSQLKEQVDIVIQNAEYEKQQAAEREARAKHRETRYCRSCGAGREFTGTEIDNTDHWPPECESCGYKSHVSKWRPKPLPELPAAVIFGTELNMSGWWWCNFCESHEPPGQARWSTIDGQEMKICQRCEKRLRPMAVEAELDEKFGLRWCPACGQQHKFLVDYIATESDLRCLPCGQLSATGDWLREPPAEAEAGPAQLDADDFGIRWCPACGERKKFSVDRIATESSRGLVCSHCGQISPTAAWLRQPPSEAEETPGSGEPEPGGAETRPDLDEAKKFDCPRCNRERIVKLNGDAWCLSCDAKWTTAAEFHVEVSAMLEAAAETGQGGGDFRLKSNFVSLLTKLNQQEVNLIGKLVNAPQRAPRGNYGYNDVAVAAAEAIQKNEDN